MRKSWGLWALGLLLVSGFVVWGRGETLAQSAPVIMSPPRPPTPSSASQMTPVFHDTQVTVLQAGKPMWMQHLRIGGWATSQISINQPTGEAVQCDNRSRPIAPMQQISISINTQSYNSGQERFNLNATFSSPDGQDACFGGRGRSISLNQPFEWTGKPIDMKVDDVFSVRITPVKGT